MKADEILEAAEKYAPEDMVGKFDRNEEGRADFIYGARWALSRAKEQMYAIDTGTWLQSAFDAMEKILTVEE